MRSLRVARAARIVRAGGVIAYPTEAVFGLGCSPRYTEAVMRVLAIKRRSWRKGLILIGADLGQLERYVVLPPEPRRSEVLATWPGPNTWVLDARPDAPRWITGGRASVAVRVTAHALAAELCRAAGEALVSTSANVSRRPPHRRLLTLRRDLGRSVDYVLAGALGGLEAPTAIRDGRTGRLLRP
ncbi:MAG TPA: Sua5/YciO/YrdC/YwlC family protein [Gammaproteobacteria bacterium]|nr:Sua5/YciO/YrdC/YwlC family protein [Gammaproteobacteria bacterium]